MRLLSILLDNIDFIMYEIGCESRCHKSHTIFQYRFASKRIEGQIRIEDNYESWFRFSWRTFMSRDFNLNFFCARAALMLNKSSFRSTINLVNLILNSVPFHTKIYWITNMFEAKQRTASAARIFITQSILRATTIIISKYNDKIK